MRLFILFALLTVGHIVSGQVISSISPYERGLWKEGTPIGKWEYGEDPGGASILVDYESGNVIFKKPDTTTFTVLVNGLWVNKKLDTPTRFLGSERRVQQHYLEEARNIRIRDRSIWLQFEVDADGIARRPVVSGEVSKKEVLQMIQIFESAPNRWLPGTLNGKQVVTRFSVLFRFCASNCSESLLKAEPALHLPWYAIFISQGRSGLGTPHSKPKPYRVSEYYFTVNQIMWSPDDRKILLKTSVNEGCFLQIFDRESLMLEKTMFSREPFFAKCLSENCELLVLNHRVASWLDNISIFNVRKNAFLEVEGKDDNHPVISSDGRIAFARYEKHFNRICITDTTGRIHCTNSISNKSLVPQVWLNNTDLLIDMRTEYQDNTLAILNTQTNTLTFLSLPVRSFEFARLSDDRTKILLREYPLPEIRTQCKLGYYDLSTNEYHEMTKIFEEYSYFSWASDSKSILYTKGNKTFLLDLDTKKPTPFSSFISPVFSNNQEWVVYRDQERKNLVVAKADGSDARVLVEIELTQK